MSISTLQVTSHQHACLDGLPLHQHVCTVRWGEGSIQLQKLLVLLQSLNSTLKKLMFLNATIIKRNLECNALLRRRC